MTYNNKNLYNIMKGITHYYIGGQEIDDRSMKILKKNIDCTNRKGGWCQAAERLALGSAEKLEGWILETLSLR